MVKCSEAGKLFYEYIDKELSQSDIDILEEHLKLCEKCFGHFEFDKALRSFVQKKCKELSTSPDFKKKLINKLKEDCS